MLISKITNNGIYAFAASLRKEFKFKWYKIDLLQNLINNVAPLRQLSIRAALSSDFPEEAESYVLALEGEERDEVGHQVRLYQAALEEAALHPKYRARYDFVQLGGIHIAPRPFRLQ